MTKRDYCLDCTQDDNGDHPMKRYEGLKAQWMTNNCHEILFCPLCGQIYIKMTKDSNPEPIVIDEYENSGN